MSTVDLTDVKRLEDSLNVLENQAKDKIIYSSLVRGGKVLYDATRQSLTNKMGYSATKAISNGKGSYPALITGVRMSGNRTYSEVNVNIMGHGFLKWFEKGTTIRQTKKGANRGSIKGLNFFFAARQSSLAKMTSEIYNTIDKQIKKVLQ